MKLRHGEMEVCRGNPQAWATSKLVPGSGPRMSYERVAVMAIYHLHKHGDVPGSLTYLLNLAAKYKLTNPVRLEQYEEKVSAYAAWLDAARPVVVARKFNIRLQLTTATYLAGEVSRLDVDLASGGYRAVVLSDKIVDIRTELRMPLLQMAIATRFGRDVEDVAIGIQSLDASDSDVRSFSQTEISDALTEGVAIAETIDSVNES